LKTLSHENFIKARDYVFAHSDDINRAWFRYNFENENTAAFMDVLAQYQHEDGGFGGLSYEFAYQETCLKSKTRMGILLILGAFRKMSNMDIKIGHEQPNDYECFGTRIGKWTYFGDDIKGAIENGHVQSIGRFTSIHHSAIVQVDHQFNMAFLSDEIVNVFSEKHKAMFKQRLLEDPKLPSTPTKSHPLTIGNDVWIGANTFINSSRVKSIGDGAIIGSGAVALEDVPPYAIAVGVPAKIKRYRFTPEQIKILLSIRWWDWDDDTIDENAELLMYPKKLFERYQDGQR
jgi:aminocyclitol acetyltransferase